MHDDLMRAVSASLSGAGFPSSYANNTLTVAGCTYRARSYGRGVYIDRWRVPRANTSTATGRVVGYVLSQLPYKKEEAEREEKRRTREEEAARSAAMFALAGFKYDGYYGRLQSVSQVPIDDAKWEALAVVLLRTPHFVDAAPFLAQARDDPFTALALTDLLEEKGASPELLEAVRGAYS